MGDAYKRTVQKKSFFYGLVIAVTMNINTIDITKALYQSNTLRDSMVQIAESTIQYDKEKLVNCWKMPEDEREQDDHCKKHEELVKLITKEDPAMETGLPIGWTSPAEFKEKAFNPINWLGWFLTALALSMGAPFWFDFLNKFVNIRHAMLKPSPPPDPNKNSKVEVTGTGTHHI